MCAFCALLDIELVMTKITDGFGNRAGSCSCRAVLSFQNGAGPSTQPTPQEDNHSNQRNQKQALDDDPTAGLFSVREEYRNLRNGAWNIALYCGRTR